VCLQSLPPSPKQQFHTAIILLGDLVPRKIVACGTFTNNPG
jgi:hypothetical protein